MKNYFSMPQFQAPGGVDLSPIHNALNAYQKAGQHNALMAQRQEEQTYQRGRDAKQDARQATVDARQQVEWFGKTAAAIDRLEGPQRATAWQGALRRHPNAAGLAPEYLDPVNGPKMVMAEAGQWRDPREDQIKDLDLQYKQAQIGKLNAEARSARQPAPKVQEMIDEQGNKYMAQWDGSGWQRVGGVTRKPSVAETAVDRAFGKTYEEDFASGGIADQEKNLSQLRDVRDTLQNPNGPNVTGPILGRLPDAVATFTNPAAVDTRERVEEVVQRNLRVILGAQFTNEEGKRLIARAYNPALPEAVNAQRLTNLINAMDGALEAKKQAAQYYEQNGTLRGYRGTTNFSVHDFEQAIEAGGQPAPQPTNRSGRAGGNLPTAAPVSVNSPEDAMRLPSGTLFVTPDGRQKVRP